MTRAQDSKDVERNFGYGIRSDQVFNDWTGYYTYDPRGSVSGVTDAEGMIWQSYRYDVFGDIIFAKPQFNNVYGYNAESYNPNIDMQYLRARYYNPGTAAFMTEDSYLGELADPLTLNRYNYVKSSPLNYIDPSGHWSFSEWGNSGGYDYTGTPEYWNEQAAQKAGEDFSRFLKNTQSALADWIEKSGGTLTLFTIGSGKDKLEVKIQLALDSGEFDLCNAVKEISSFMLGMRVEADEYFNTRITANRMFNKLGALDSLTKVLLGNDITEDFIVNQYLSSESYYSGKLLMDYIEIIVTGAENDLINGLNSSLGNMKENAEKAAIAFAGASLLTGAGAAPFTSGSSMAVGATAAGVASVAGVGTIVVAGTGEAVGNLISIATASANSHGQTNADKNQGKLENPKGDSGTELTSSIDKDPRLVKAAEEMGENERIQQEANHLIDELLKGNENPGLGSKNLFKDVSYLRGRNGARVFYRKTATGYEILGKADKANEQTVINILKKLYEW